MSFKTGLKATFLMSVDLSAASLTKTHRCQLTIFLKSLVLYSDYENINHSFFSMCYCYCHSTLSSSLSSSSSSLSCKAVSSPGPVTRTFVLVLAQSGCHPCNKTGYMIYQGMYERTEGEGCILTSKCHFYFLLPPRCSLDFYLLLFSYS